MQAWEGGPVLLGFAGGSHSGVHVLGGGLRAAGRGSRGGEGKMTKQA